MKMTWKKTGNNKKKLPIPQHSNLPFETDDTDDNPQNNDNTILSDSDTIMTSPNDSSYSTRSESDASLAESFLQLGNKLAEEGKYGEALAKWEGAIMLMPEKAVIHEQKAQVLLEIADTWGALKAATRATELDPSWDEAWVTLGRAQLNFGEPDKAIESFDNALAIKPDLTEAKDDRQIALKLVKKRTQLHSSGVSIDGSRYAVGDSLK